RPRSPIRASERRFSRWAWRPEAARRSSSTTSIAPSSRAGAKPSRRRGTFPSEPQPLARAMERGMARPFGDYPPVENFLGRETLAVLVAPDRVESSIIEVDSQPSGVGFAGCTVLAQGPLLTDAQAARLTGCILRPEAHYNGQPVFRRRPSIPNFAFR